MEGNTKTDIAATMLDSTRISEVVRSLATTPSSCYWGQCYGTWCAHLAVDAKIGPSNVLGRPHVVLGCSRVCVPKVLAWSPEDASGGLIASPVPI